jgi:Minichromosome loss protein, Mcl1, middle region
VTYSAPSFGFLLQNDGALKADFVRQVAELDSAPTDLLWEDDNRLLIACGNGQLVTISERIVPEHSVTSKKSAEGVDDDMESALAANKSQVQSVPKSTKGVLKHTAMTDFDSSDEDDKTTTTKKASTTTVPKSAAGRLKKTAMTQFDNSSDEEDFGSHEESPPTSQPKKSRFVDDEAAEDDDDDDDVTINATQQHSPTANGSPKAAGGRTFPDEDDDASVDDVDMPDRLYHRTTASAPIDLPEPQPAFAPSSSPLDLPRRFMCWNHIGSVTLRRDETGEGRSTVDINFTDSGFRRPIGFTDNLGFILGSLGEDGGIFTTDLAEDDDGDDDLLGDAVPGLSDKTREAVKRFQRKQDPNKPTGSSIYFHRFETFGSLRDKDWYLTLPHGERALGCATGEGWASVMTRYVSTARKRLFCCDLVAHVR